MAEQHNRIFLRLLTAALALSWLPAGAGAAGDPICTFGDSLSDTGNVFFVTGELSQRPYDPIPSAPYPIGGINFSNGRLWIEHLVLAEQRRRDARPALRQPGRFCNYAFGGARARQIDPARFDLPAQVATYLTDFAAQPDPASLYAIMIGGNDVRDALTALALDPSGVTSGLIIADSVSSISNQILALYNLAQARRFLVFNAPNLGVTPAVAAQGPAAQAVATALSQQFALDLSAALDNLDLLAEIDITRVDLFALINQIAVDPPAGISNTTDSCITPGLRPGAICDEPDSFAFWDFIHPTRVVHRLIYEAAAGALDPGIPLASASGF